MKFHYYLLLSAVSASLSSATAINPGNSYSHGNENCYTKNSKYIHKFPQAPTVPGSYIITLTKSSNVDKHFDSFAKLVGKSRSAVIHGDNLENLCSNLNPTSASNDPKVVAQFGEGDQFSYVAFIGDDTLNKLMDEDDVQYVEPDYKVTACGTAVQYGAPWGLSRLSNQNRLSIDDRSVFSFLDYSTSNVGVFVIDSGINIDHEEFGGRAANSANYVTGEGYEDNFGHGTHVAGTIGGTTFGVAKQAKIYNVKVLGSDGNGSNSAVIAGISFVAAQKKKYPSSRFVINLSIGGPQTIAEENAIRGAIKAGVHFVAAAGNSNIDACTTSPGSSSKDGAIVVGATSSKDAFAHFSNWGKCVDVLAPGVDILSSWNQGPKSVHCLQGTSMASPHVAGLVAYWYANDGTLTPEKMKKKVIQYSQSGKISGLSNGTPNRMVWNGL